MIIVSTITFYIFSITLIVFNHLVNDVAFYNYLQEIGSVTSELNGDEFVQYGNYTGTAADLGHPVAVYFKRK